MEPYDLDFEVFNTPGDSFLNVHPEPYMQADFSGFEDLKYFQNEIFHPNEQIEIMKAQDEQGEVSLPVETKKVSENRYWTKEEREKFHVALKMFGTDFEAIAAFVGTRNSTQVRTHAQKYYAKMVRDYKKNGKASQTQNKGQKSSCNN